MTSSKLHMSAGDTHDNKAMSQSISNIEAKVASLENSLLHVTQELTNALKNIDLQNNRDKSLDSHRQTDFKVTGWHTVRVILIVIVFLTQIILCPIHQCMLTGETNIIRNYLPSQLKNHGMFGLTDLRMLQKGKDGHLKN